VDRPGVAIAKSLRHRSTLADVVMSCVISTRQSYERVAEWRLSSRLLAAGIDAAR
jgi:hypothetical protein